MDRSEVFVCVYAPFACALYQHANTRTNTSSLSYFIMTIFIIYLINMHVQHSFTHADTTPPQEKKGGGGDYVDTNPPPPHTSHTAITTCSARTNAHTTSPHLHLDTEEDKLL
jgi:hypothetical protein